MRSEYEANRELMKNVAMARNMTTVYKNRVTHKRLRQCEALLKLMTGVAVASTVGLIFVWWQL